MMKFLFLALFFSLGTGNASGFPELKYNGTPVGPECVLAIVTGKAEHGRVNLKGNACQENQQPYDPEMLKKGFIGYTLKTTDPVMKQPYVYYKYLGRYHGEAENFYDLLEIQWSDGTTGSFSALMTYSQSKDGDKDYLLGSWLIDQGDRCNGSVHDAFLKNGTLVYKKNVTSLGLMKLLFRTKEDLPPFEDCAVCCIGNVSYQDQFIKGMEFTGKASDLKTKIDQEKDNPLQQCFDTLILEKLNEGKSYLSSSELKAFGDKVLKTCKL